MGDLTTIRISTDVRDALLELKQGREDYNTTLKRIIEGYVEMVDNIERPQVAITLTYIGYAHGTIDEQNILNITFEDLKNAEVNDEFEPQKGDQEYYELTHAKVIYKDNDTILLKLTQDSIKDTGTMRNVDVVNVCLL